jgi:hypothetical protein
VPASIPSLAQTWPGSFQPPATTSSSPSPEATSHVAPWLRRCPLSTRSSIATAPRPATHGTANSREAAATLSGRPVTFALLGSLCAFPLAWAPWAWRHCPELGVCSRVATPVSSEIL